MKIFLISNMFPSHKDPDYGIFVRNIEQNLENSGAEINYKSVIRGRKSGFLKKLIAYLHFYFNIAKNYYFGHYDLIYVHFISHTAPIAFVLSLLSVKKRIWVINVHGSDIITHNKGVLKYFIRKTVSFSDLLVVPSSYFSQKIKEIFPYYSESCLYVSPSGGIDSAVFHPLSSQQDNKLLTLGFVSRIEERKGWQTLLNSLKQLKNSGVQFFALIVGKGSQMHDLENWIENSDLRDMVKYLGVIPQKELVHIYNKLDIFIFPSEENESLGLVGIEAMACGTPVIGSNKAGIKTYVKDGVNGFLFETGNSEQLTEAIKKYIRLDEREKHRLRENALKTADLYEKNKVGIDLHNRFNQLLSENNHSKSLK